MTQTIIQPNLQSWGLSPQSVSLLSKESDLLADIARDRERPPLPPGYIPEVVEVLFDDLPYIRSENGTVTYLRDCPADYNPTFVEFRLDDETAMFKVGGEYVVNRMEGIAQVQKLLASVEEGGTKQ